MMFLTSDEWVMAKRLLIAGMDSDHKKTMYSGGIKRKLDSEAEKLTKKYESIDPDFSKLLMTPSFDTFYLAWDLDHKKYILKIMQGESCDDIKRELVDKYHSGDESVFRLRLNQIKEKDPNKTVEELETEINNLEGFCKDNAMRKKYFILERPDIQNFENLLRFDNTTEYEYTYSLKGFPDLFLREEILKRLIEKGKIAKEKSVFSISLDEFVAAIDELINEEKQIFTIRLRKYLQHYDTCGTVCIMSILNRKGLPLDEDMELRVWEMVGKPYNFPGGLASVLLRNKFNVTYIQNHSELLRKDNPEFYSMSNHLFGAANEYVKLFEEALGYGLKFRVKDWNFETVWAEINRGNPCIVYLHVSDTVTHVVLVHGIKNNTLKIMDPLGNIKFLSKEEFDKKIINPMGKRLLIVNKLPEDFFDVLDKGLSNVGY